MAITTDNEKFSCLTFNRWTVASVPISADGIGNDDQKQMLRGFPTQTYTGAPGGAGSPNWITRARRRGTR